MFFLQSAILLLKHVFSLIRAYAVTVRPMYVRKAAEAKEIGAGTPFSASIITKTVENVFYRKVV